MTEDQKCELEIAMVNATTKEQIDDLVKRGADVDNNSLLDNGMTLLMQACKYGDIEVALALIANKANVNAQDNNGKTALMYAAQTENSALLIESLHKAGAEINAQDYDGLTALMWSCLTERLESFKTLIKLKADIYLRDKEGKSLDVEYMWYANSSEFERILNEEKLRLIEANKNQHRNHHQWHKQNRNVPHRNHRD